MSWAESSCSNMCSTTQSLSEGSHQPQSTEFGGGSLSSATLSSMKDDDSSEYSDLNKFEMDRAILPNSDHINNRRTVVVMRTSFDESFGFALQSYVFKRCNTGATERVTYVDYVRCGGPAARAGIRKGDVVVAVNNVSVVGESHSSLVSLISSQLTMRLVLLFQNIARVIQLSARSLQLQYILKEKEKIVDSIIKEELRLLKQYGESESVQSSEEKSSTTSGSSLLGVSPCDKMICCSVVEDEPASDLTLLVDDNEKMCDPGTFGVGFNHVIRVDSQSSLSRQVTRL